MWRNIDKSKSAIFSTIFPGCTIVVFDTETTGLNSAAKIIQFSAVKYILNKDLSFSEIGSIDLYVNPEEKLPEKIIEITGITDEMLENQPTEQQLAPEIFNFMEDSDVWFAYNIAFDLRMMNQMSDRIHFLFETNPYFDVLDMARDLISPEQVDNYKLCSVTEFLFPDDMTQFHSAIEDVRATAKVLNMFLRGYRKYKKADNNKSPIHLESAHLFINPRRKSQQRLVTKLSQGEDGSVYYDIVKKAWSCKSDSTSKKLFESIDLADLEKQFLNKYGYRYGHETMDEIAKAWMKYRREKGKERKQQQMA